MHGNANKDLFNWIVKYVIFSPLTTILCKAGSDQQRLYLNGTDVQWAGSQTVKVLFRKVLLLTSPSPQSAARHEITAARWGLETNKQVNCGLLMRDSICHYGYQQLSWLFSGEVMQLFTGLLYRLYITLPLILSPRVPGWLLPLPGGGLWWR